ncbi:MAG: prepilin-type N-terminal cleavage/methylation domain-containing protein [candidate division NC10 bacterium]
MKSWGDQKGFTLLEVLIASVIMVIVLFAVYVTYETSYATFNRGQNKLEVQQTARVAMEILAREIQTAGYDPSNAMNLLPTTAVQVANANTLTIIADVDGDNVTDQVTYRLQGTQIVRDFASWGGAAFPAAPPVSDQLADGVIALTFTYFDGNDPNNEIAAPVPAASLTAIRLITIGFTAQGTAADISDTLPLTMDVRLRNP